MQVSHEPQSANDELLTVKEVAAILRISASTVYRMAEQRCITFYRMPRYIRFRRSDVDAFIAGCVVKPINEYERSEIGKQLVD